MRPSHLALIVLLLAPITAMAETPSATLYRYIDFAGPRVEVHGAISDLSARNFDDRASSLRITSGTWEICREPGFRSCMTFMPGTIRDLTRTGWNDAISSLRPIAEATPYRDRVDHYNEPRTYREQAPAITVFEHHGLRGESLTFYDPVDNLNAFRWNDRISSYRIEAGEWEICRAGDFRECRPLDRRQGDLERDWNDHASSLRPIVDGSGDYGRHDRYDDSRADLGRGAAITVFEHSGLRGERIRITEPVDNLKAFGWNDRISSYRIEAGEWEICRAGGFRECRPLYRREGDMERDWNDHASSLRPISSSGRQSHASGNWVRLGRPHDRASLTVFEHDDHRGESITFTEAVANLNAYRWNDRISSFRVNAGRWEVCRAKDFRECQVIDGRSPYAADLGIQGWNDEISSLRPID